MIDYIVLHGPHNHRSLMFNGKKFVLNIFWGISMLVLSTPLPAKLPRHLQSVWIKSLS